MTVIAIILEYWHKFFLLSADRYLEPLQSEQHHGCRANPTDICFNGAYEVRCNHKESIRSLEFMNINKIRPHAELRSCG